MKWRDDIAPRPWKAKRRLFADGTFGFALDGGVTTAEARLIAKAVNHWLAKHPPTLPPAVCVEPHP